MNWFRIPLVLAGLLLTPSIADAHLVTSGLGPFYDGALHLAFSPEDLLGLLAIALLAGLCGPNAGRWTVMIVPVAWLGGAVIGLQVPDMPPAPMLGVVSLVLLGLFVALDLKLPDGIIATLGALFGLLHGLLNGVALSAAPQRGMNLLGILTTVFVLLLLVSAIAVSLRSGWTRIALRVVGSWIVAVGMLMFGWLSRGVA
jgi:hydrogenase/urease accessory protein HupE